MTSKEALEKLNNLIWREKHINSEKNKTINECVNTIKQDLEHLEMLEKEKKEIEGLVDSLSKEKISQVEKIFDLEIENEKLKKAIEIDLKYDVILKSVKRLSYVDYVELCIMFNEAYPTQEEYDLLIEVLGE